MRQKSIIHASLAAAGAFLGSTIIGCTHAGDRSAPVNEHVPAASAVARGEYLVRIGGCNDCHTPGYSQSGGNVPMSAWLTGVPVGSRGPWGTTYASNLRIYVDPMSEDDWVKVIRARNDKPPMPWVSLHAMNDADLRAVHRFIKSLGKTGTPMPEYVPPGVEPKTPWLVFAPPTMPGEKK